jgi:hypothetical protein
MITSLGKSTVVLTVVLLCCTSCGSKEGNSEGPSESTIRDLLFENNVGGVLLGPQVVTEGTWNPANREIRREEFEDVLAWAKAGMVTYTAEDVLSDQKQPTLDDWFARTQNGHLKRITVTQTERGKRLDAAAPADSPADHRRANFSYVLYSTLQLKKIISMEPKLQATTRYCVVRALQSKKFTPEGKEIFAQMPHRDPVTESWRSAETYKVVLLFKYDPFEKKWVRVADDKTPEGQEFRTNYVDQALLKAQ